MVPVDAPRFRLAECNTDSERLFIEALHARSVAGGWVADSWPQPDRIIVSICRQNSGGISHTLRVDFDGASIKYGYDETQQFVTEMSPADGAKVATGRSPAELAGVAADWLEREMTSWRTALAESVQAGAIALAVVGFLSFACGEVVGAIYSLVTGREIRLTSFGIATAKVGLLVLGAPVSITLAILAWRRFVRSWRLYRQPAGQG
jgi:hypothetical protein